MKHTFILTAGMLMMLSAGMGQAADFDGSRPLICATVEAVECLADADCEAGTPDEMGAPNFMRIDFAARTVAGDRRTTKILGMDKSAEQVQLRGNELGYAWTMMIDPRGKMTATMTGLGDAFVLFGSCTIY